jgi:hypothetical protein
MIIQPPFLVALKRAARADDRTITAVELKAQRSRLKAMPKDF